MGYCFNDRKILWAIIPNDTWYTISRPCYFIRRNLKIPWGFSCYLFEIFLALKFRPRCFRNFYFLTNPFSDNFNLRQSAPVSFRSRFGSGSVPTVFHHDRDRPSPWPSTIVIVTVHRLPVSPTVHHRSMLIHISYRDSKLERNHKIII